MPRDFCNLTKDVSSGDRDIWQESESGQRQLVCVHATVGRPVPDVRHDRHVHQSRRFHSSGCASGFSGTETDIFFTPYGRTARHLEAVSHEERLHANISDAFDIARSALPRIFSSSFGWSQRTRTTMVRKRSTVRRWRAGETAQSTD